MPFPTDPDQALRREAVAALLRALPVGGVLPYRDAGAAAGLDGATLRFLLKGARELVERETGARFATVRKVGVRRLETAEIAGIAAAARRSINRKARQAFRRLSDIRANDLDAAARTRIDAERSVLGAISVMTRETTTARVLESASTGPVLSARVFELAAKP